MPEGAPVLLCCDVDPDRERYVRGGGNRQEFQWRGATQGIPRLLDSVRMFEREHGNRVAFNWFFRSDLQIEAAHGDPAWPYRAWPELVDRVCRRSDELGWHPHFWRLHDDGKSWFQETQDLEYLGGCLKKGYDSIPSKLKPLVVRTGWDFQNAFTMKFLSDLGLLADLSALPGIVSGGSRNRETDRPLVVRDWAGAPDRPYFPSARDPRREAKNRSESLTMLEIPVSTFSLPSTIRMVRGARDKIRGLKGRSEVSEPYLTKRPTLFRAAAKYHVRHRNASAVPFVAIFHADELLQEEGAYSIGNVMKNLAVTVETFGDAGLQARFERASTSAKELLGGVEG